MPESRRGLLQKTLGGAVLLAVAGGGAPRLRQTNKKTPAAGAGRATAPGGDEPFRPRAHRVPGPEAAPRRDVLLRSAHVRKRRVPGASVRAGQMTDVCVIGSG